MEKMTEEEIKQYFVNSLDDCHYVYLDKYQMKITNLDINNISIKGIEKGREEWACCKGKRILDLYGDPVKECDLDSIELLDDTLENTTDHFHSKYVKKIKID